MKFEEIIKDIEKNFSDYSKHSSVDDVFINHILPVKNFAIQLAEIYDADIEVVTIASLMHDVSYIYDEEYKNHEIRSMEIAKKYLKGKMSKDKINKICKCIKNHRGAKVSKKKSIEEEIVACADAMSHFCNVFNLIYVFGALKKGSIEDAKLWIAKKIDRSWNKVTLRKAKELIKDKYLASKVFMSLNSADNKFKFTETHGN